MKAPSDSKLSVVTDLPHCQVFGTSQLVGKWTKEFGNLSSAGTL